MRSLVRVLVFIPVLLTAGCGQVDFRDGAPGQSLCLDYFQHCIVPVLDNPITFISTNTCSASGCHRNGGSAGDSFKITPAAAPISPVNLLNALGSDVYGNFLSAKGSVDLNTTSKSDLLRKPLGVVLHGGGIIFDNSFPEYDRLQQWAGRKVANPFDACGNLFSGLTSDSDYATSSADC